MNCPFCDVEPVVDYDGHLVASCPCTVVSRDLLFTDENYQLIVEEWETEVFAREVEEGS